MDIPANAVWALPLNTPSGQTQSKTKPGSQPRAPLPGLATLHLGATAEAPSEAQGKALALLTIRLPTGLCWWHKTYPAEHMTQRLCPEVVLEQAAQVPRRQSNQRQGPRASSRGRSRATAAADLELVRGDIQASQLFNVLDF